MFVFLQALKPQCFHGNTNEGDSDGEVSDC